MSNNLIETLSQLVPTADSARQFLKPYAAEPSAVFHSVWNLSGCLHE
jgi:hypothetical protein